MSNKLIKIAIYTSIFILFFKKLSRRYYFIKLWLGRIFKDSQIYKFAVKFLIGTKINFKYSFLERITEINMDKYAVILDNSEFLKRFLKIFKILKLSVIDFSKTCVVIGSIKTIKKELYLLPVRIVSSIIVTAIIVNIIFSTLLNKEIGLSGWIIRAIFLFVGLTGLSCSANWGIIKKTNLIFKHIST